MVKIKIDVVGGGLGGLSAAISLKETNKDISVSVHEKYKEIGYNHEGRRCGEAYTCEGEQARWKPIGKSIFNIITRVETIVGDRKYTLKRAPGTSYMLNKQEFICQLARDAEKLGVEIKTNDKIKSVGDLDGDYIVDASGCPSSIKRELGLSKGIKGFTYQQTLEDSNFFVSDVVKVIFTGSPGYYWIFPRNPEKREINLGLGVAGTHKCNLKEMLEAFKEEHDIEGKINYVAGGLIPAGIQKPLIYKNILFVGDAGVGTQPLTGEGIYRALISGTIAGKCLAQNYPKKYPLIITSKFIKWDKIGEIIIRKNGLLQKISPKAVLIFLKYLESHSYQKYELCTSLMDA